METITLTIVLPLVLTAVMSIAGYILKNVYDRLLALENKMHKAISDEDVRLILGDKIDPLKEDVGDIKLAILKFYDLYMDKKQVNLNDKNK